MHRSLAVQRILNRLSTCRVPSIVGVTICHRLTVQVTVSNQSFRCASTIATPFIMRLYQAISVLAALGLVPAYAAPSLFDDAQRVMSNPYLDQARHDVKDIASQYLSDAKKAVLKGKKNLEKWYHEGKEFIKQDNLLCESTLLE